jgi:hypothetical protein
MAKRNKAIVVPEKMREWITAVGKELERSEGVMEWPESASDIFAAAADGNLERLLLLTWWQGYDQGVSSIHKRFRWNCEVAEVPIPKLLERTDIAGAYGEELRKRVAGKRTNDAGRRADAESRAKMCRTVYAEFTPADIKKFGHPMVYRDVGKLAAARLELPEPIKARTVRSYIEKAKRDNG